METSKLAEMPAQEVSLHTLRMKYCKGDEQTGITNPLNTSDHHTALGELAQQR